jgi:hypothetical protein
MAKAGVPYGLLDVVGQAWVLKTPIYSIRCIARGRRSVCLVSQHLVGQHHLVAWLFTFEPLGRLRPGNASTPNDQDGFNLHDRPAAT